MAFTKEHADANKLLETMREQYTKASDACAKLYEAARDDIKFVTVPGEQWDPTLRERRKNRPMYEFPKLRGQIKQIVNEIRQARPQGKVRGVEEADQGLAELMQGIIRNIESVSNAEDAYDVAAQSAVKGGLGIWRICTDYLNDDDFEQDIRVRAVRNFAAAKCDPAAVEIDRRDARFWFIEELMARSAFEAAYGKDKLKDFDLDSRCQKDWAENDQVRVAEYWYKKPVDRDLLALSTGETVWEDELPKGDGGPQLPLGAQVVKKRTVKTHKVCMRITNGHDWLTDEYEFPSKFIPIVPVWGDIQNIDGEDYWCGEVRPAKDGQRLHNAHRTALIEAIAKAPKAPFIAKPKWVGQFFSQWQNANSEDYSTLWLDDDADGVPERVKQAEVPVALIQAAGMDSDDMKASTGQYDASLGARSNETSGKAINARKLQGSTATFNYPDNLAKAIRFTYEIIGDMIPRVYDTPRVVRVLGPDGGEKWHQLYQEVPDPTAPNGVRVLNDLSKGKYDYTVTMGPSYATQRMETADLMANALSQIGPAAPQFAPLFAYGIVSNMDGPGLEEFQTAARKVVVQMGLLPPKEGEDPPAPPQPNPKDVADAAQKQSTAVLNQAKAEGQQLDNAAKGAQLVAMHAMPPHPMAPPQPMFPPDQMGPGMQPPQGGFFSPDGSPSGFTGF